MTNRIICADSANNRVQVLEKDGTSHLVVGRFGLGDGEFDSPVSVAMDHNSGHIFVGDFIESRVQEFDQDGTWVRT